MIQHLYLWNITVRWYTRLGLVEWQHQNCGQVRWQLPYSAILSFIAIIHVLEMPTNVMILNVWRLIQLILMFRTVTLTLLTLRNTSCARCVTVGKSRLCLCPANPLEIENFTPIAPKYAPSNPQRTYRTTRNSHPSWTTNLIIVFFYAFRFIINHRSLKLGG